MTTLVINVFLLRLLYDAIDLDASIEAWYSTISTVLLPVDLVVDFNTGDEEYHHNHEKNNDTSHPRLHAGSLT